MNALAPASVDVLVAGGGMVGASLALALARGPHSVMLVEAVPPETDGQPSYDDRTTALGNGSRTVLGSLGAWRELSPLAGPVREIRVSEAGRYGGARIEARELGLDALGYVVNNRHLGAALWGALRQLPPERLQVHCPARIAEPHFAADAVHTRLTAPDGAVREVRARLVVAADGAASPLRAAAGIGSASEDYNQVAIVVHLATDQPSRCIAHERFTPTGPLAVLPLADGRHTVVWTLEPARARAVLAQDDAGFGRELQACLGWRIGRIRRLGARASYPLRLGRALDLAGPRTVVVGNAAQSLHPVAGQGFNLGLRDAALLAQVLGAADDPGAPAVLEDYARRRMDDRRGMIGFTDGLVRLFASEHEGPMLARSLGLALFDLALPAKRAMSRLGWGFGSEAPRLLRGLAQ
jgi:2-octaprenyl-6-methoxyphenol hydroxylase